MAIDASLARLWYNSAMKSLHLSRPHAIMMVGIPGSGKSFFASQFADTFGTPYIDFGTIADITDDAEKASEITLICLAEIAKTEQTFIFEGSGASRTYRTEFAKWARSLGYTPLFIWTQVDQATALKRSSKTNHYTKQEFGEHLKAFSPPHPDEKPLVISGKHTYASQAKAVLSFLSQDNRPLVQKVTAPARPVQHGRSITVQ